MPRVNLPLEFTSALTPEECASRLELKRGNYLGVRVKVNVQPQEYKSYRFQVHVTTLHNRNFADLLIDGKLESLKYDGTRVVIERSRLGLLGNIRSILTFAVTVVIVLGVFGLFSGQSPNFGVGGFPLFMAIVLATLLSIAMSFGSQSTLKQVIQLIEDAVSTEESSSKPAQLLNDLVEHLGGAKPKRHS